MARLVGARFSLTVGAALLCAHGSIWAQSAKDALEPLVVTATRTPTAISQVVADVTVITREDIERQASGTMVDLLSHVAGFQVARNGGPGADGNVYLRGGETRHIAVLIDGVRVDTQNGSGGASWQMLNLSQIDRVEIVRGPVSALYGSDAISGVVQIFTKKGKGPASFDLGVSAGELGFVKTDAGLSGSAGMFDYAVSAAKERSDGFSAKTNFKPGTRAADRDGYTTEGGSARLGFTPVKEHRIEATATQQHLNSRYDASISSTKDDYSVRDLRDLKLQWNAQWLDNWLSQVVAGQSVDRYATPLTGYLTQTHVDTASWINEVKWGAHSVSTVLERREDNLKNSDVVLSGTSGEGHRSDDGLGLGYAWRAHGTAIQLNARHDWDSEFGTHSTGSAAVGQDFADHWNVHASWGTGYRAPTLYQRFSKYGNLTLQPESSRNAELGVRYQKDGAQWGLTVYNNWVTDLITGPPDSAKTCVQDRAYCYKNTALAHLQGVSLNGAVPLGPVRLSGDIDFDSSKNALNDTDLPRRARRHASLRLDTDLKQWTLGAQLLAVGKRFDKPNNAIALGGYTVVNVDALYRINAQWRLLARIDNVADRKYENAQTYSSTPRTAIIGVRWTPSL
ncbi:TonB-dependent receptor [Aquabacterium sp.]|uniref:TonB-dependent receptor domain-containing protein n=1 Tax=Aquabacterium sp. TaxID=1872578 RepID=UPI0019BEFABE|nr:TonB-dependent receptor [Aquabacterium sp.]MBC7700079.1 TonB-dependent receptor [Aquabacterium sp.]